MSSRNGLLPISEVETGTKTNTSVSQHNRILYDPILIRKENPGVETFCLVRTNLRCTFGTPF